MFSGLIYILWKIREDMWKVSVLCAKARVAPINGITQPRSELCYAVVLARQILSVIKVMEEKPGWVIQIECQSSYRKPKYKSRCLLCQAGCGDPGLCEGLGLRS